MLSHTTTSANQPNDARVTGSGDEAMFQIKTDAQSAPIKNGAAFCMNQRRVFLCCLVSCCCLSFSLGAFAHLIVTTMAIKLNIAWLTIPAMAIQFVALVVSKRLSPVVVNEVPAAREAA